MSRKFFDGPPAGDSAPHRSLSPSDSCVPRWWAKILASPPPVSVLVSPAGGAKMHASPPPLVPVLVSPAGVVAAKRPGVDSERQPPASGHGNMERVGVVAHVDSGLRGQGGQGPDSAAIARAGFCVPRWRSKDACFAATTGSGSCVPRGRGWPRSGRGWTLNGSRRPLGMATWSEWAWWPMLTVD